MNGLAPYDVAAWALAINGQDLSPRINPRFMSLTLTEHRCDEADQLDVELSDHDGLLEIPAVDAVLSLQLGWRDGGLVDKGTYNVDEVAHRGAPDVITLRARSATLTGTLRTRTERSFHDQTVGQIVETIATANKLQPVVGDGLAGRQVAHIDQTNESDANFLTRLGKLHDAVATIKEDRLLFMPTQGGKTAGGADMPHHIIRRRDGDQHAWSMVSRDSYSGVRATWRDVRKAKNHYVYAGEKGNAKALRDVYTTKDDALVAAAAEWNRLKRGVATMQFVLARGMPTLSVQHTIRFADMKSPISDVDWLVKSLTHTLNDSGLTTSLDLELTGDESAE